MVELQALCECCWVVRVFFDNFKCIDLGWLCSSACGWYSYCCSGVFNVLLLSAMMYDINPGKEAKDGEGSHGGEERKSPGMRAALLVSVSMWKTLTYASGFRS